MLHEDLLLIGLELQLWRPSYSTEKNGLGHFGRGCYEEHFCEINLNLGEWFRRRCQLLLQVYTVCLEKTVVCPY